MLTAQCRARPAPPPEPRAPSVTRRRPNGATTPGVRGDVHSRSERFAPMMPGRSVPEQCALMRWSRRAGLYAGFCACRGRPRAGDGHPSRPCVAARLERPTRMLGRAALEHILSGLAPGGVYRAAPVTRHAGGLLHHRFTLTRPRTGGLFSVALSRGSPRVGVTHHPALWSPDVPRDARRRHAAARPARLQAPHYPAPGGLPHRLRWIA